MTKTQATHDVRWDSSKTVIASYLSKAGRRVYRPATDHYEARNWLLSRSRHTVQGSNKIETLAQISTGES